MKDSLSGMATYGSKGKKRNHDPTRADVDEACTFGSLLRRPNQLLSAAKC